MSNRSEILVGLLKEFTEEKRDRISYNRNMAVGYAWGFQDCQAMNTDLEDRHKLRDTLDASEFAMEYAIRVARYTRGERGSYPSIVSAYGTWCDGRVDEEKW